MDKGEATLFESQDMSDFMSVKHAVDNVDFYL